MRIGISGVSSTGKTTLARMVSEVLRLPLLDEGMKDVYARRAGYDPANLNLGVSPPVWSNLSLHDKIEFQIEMIRHRSAMEFEMEEFVGDGTPLDIMAFWLEWSTTNGASINQSTLDEMDSILRKALERYDLIFQLPFGILPIEDDKRRITNGRFLQKINYLLMEISDAHMGIQTGPIIQRIAKIPLADRVDHVIQAVGDFDLDHPTVASTVPPA